VTILIALIGLSVVGIGTVLWLLRNENIPENALSLSNAKRIIKPLEDIPRPKVKAAPTPSSPRKKSSLLAHLIPQKKESIKTNNISPTPRLSTGSVSDDLSEAKFKNKFIQRIRNVIANRSSLEKKQSSESQEKSPLLILSDIIEEKRKEEDIDNPARVDGPPIGTASIKTVSMEKTPISDENVNHINKEIQLTTDLKGLKEKYIRLDTLCIEKNSELERVNKALENELNHRKEFNKVKDLLEKELKESKERTRGAQQELNAARSEGGAHKKRVLLLEEKVTHLEKTLLEEKDTIEKLRAQSTALTTANADATPSAVTSEETKDPHHLITPSNQQENVDENAILNQAENPVPVIEDAPTPASLPLDYDAPVEDGSNGFLKLQPDVMSRLDHEKNQSSLKDSVETSQPTTPPKEIIDIIDPKEISPQDPSPHQQGVDKSDINTDKKKG
jgi:hypothetical protein